MGGQCLYELFATAHRDRNPRNLGAAGIFGSLRRPVFSVRSTIKLLLLLETRFRANFTLPWISAIERIGRAMAARQYSGKRSSTVRHNG